MPFDFNGRNNYNRTKSDSDFDYNFNKNRANGNKPQGFAPPPPKGFNDPPSIRSGPSKPSFYRPTKQLPVQNQRNKFRSPPKTRYRSSFDISYFPWKIIFIIVGIIAAAIGLWLCKDIITAFLTQVLTWAVMIVIIIFIFKYLIFRR